MNFIAPEKKEVAKTGELKERKKKKKRTKKRKRVDGQFREDGDDILLQYRCNNAFLLLLKDDFG